MKAYANRPGKFKKRKGVDSLASQSSISVILIVTIFLVLLPVLITLLGSLKTNYEAAVSIWSLPGSPRWSNWFFGFLGLLRYMFNSVVVALVVSGGSVAMSSIVAYVLVRHSFPGKEIYFRCVIALMMVPFVLTLTPLYILVNNIGIRNTWWALILPGWGVFQAGAIFLFRTFMSQQPKDLFEAAKIDGANDFIMFWRIAIPLAIPIIIIQSINTFVGVYNDFLWPMLVIDEHEKQMLMPILKTLTNEAMGVYKEQGISSAMYLMSGIPLVFTTMVGLKYFINGDFASGLKL